MNFVKQVEEQLRDLGTESRRKHPGVKEAAERAILSLRSLQNKYVVAVRRAASANSKESHPTTAIFQSQDVLRPFLLAANYPDVGNKVLNLSIDGIQTLLAGNAICKNDGVNVVRILNIQAAVCAKAIKVKGYSYQYGTAAGAIGSMIPSAGSVVNAGVGTISSLGNSILSGFGFKSGDRTFIPEEHGNNDNDGSGIGNDNESGKHSSNHSANNHSARTVASASHTSHRSLKEDEALSIRILQTVTMIVDSNGLDLSEEVLSQCIAICLVLHECGCVERTGSGFEMHGSGSSGTNSGGFGSGSQSKGQKKRSGNGNGNGSGHSQGGHQRQIQAQGKGGGGLGGSTGTGAQKVSGAASATLRQIISTLFARAAEVADIEAVKDDEHGDVYGSEPSNEGLIEKGQGAEEKQEKQQQQNDVHACLQTLASDTLLDLCNLVENKDCSGPFGQALVGQHNRIQRPTQTICLNLIEMVLEQHVNLFTNTCTAPSGAKCDFHTILKDTICPIVTHMLATCWRQDIEVNHHTTEDGPMDLVLKLSNVATAIVTKYGRILSLKMQCFDLLVASVKPIKSATNLLRDSHEFEDGYVYNTDAADDIKHDFTERQQQQGSKYESSMTMWAAAISLEVIYVLISVHFRDLITLLSTEGRGKYSETLLCTIISAVCDFAVVASSSKPSISKVVAAAGGDGETSDEEYDGESTAERKAVSELANSDTMFLCETSFDIEKIYPSLISTAKSMTEYDIGGAVWTALNCVLILWKCVQSSNDDELVHTALVDECFGPSLAAIQHFLRRCPASRIICRSSFSGYRYISKSVLSFSQGSNFKRKVVLASLCKLALPGWGKDESREFRSINVMAVSLLFQILNHHGNAICEDWLVVVTCISQLSQLTPNGAREEENIGSNLSRLGKYSTSLNSDSLKHLLSSLIKLSSSSDMRVGTGNSNVFGNLLFQSTRMSLQSTKLSTAVNDYQSLPFVLVALLAVSLENNERFNCFAEDVMSHLSDQASGNESDMVRTFSLDVISHMITSTLVSGNSQTNRINRKSLLEPLCRSIEGTNNVDAAELGLTKLKQIIEDGYNLTAAWSTIISALTAIAECLPNSRNGDWGGCCAIAFGCLKLIVGDFLNELPDQECTRIPLLDCCASFGSSRYDVNTSLTATGMLWSIADQDSSPASVDHVLTKLALLASDDRVEVRNCVVNTLFSCVVGLGQNFTTAQWEGIFTHTIFAVLKQVNEQGTATDENDEKNAAQGNKSAERYKVSVHHSRDSASKQWATTQVLTLRGIERVLRIFFDTLLETAHDYNQDSNWFEQAWHLIVDQCLLCSTVLGGRETLDLRLVGVELLVVCCQTSSKRGFIAADVRVGTNMQVVNGALRSVRAADSPPRIQGRGSKALAEDVDPLLVEKRRQLFDKSFASLMQVGTFLRNNEDSVIEGTSGYIDSIVLQILTKLGIGLGQLYECCKDHELSPQNEDGDAEENFVDLVTLITRIATGGPNSKFLTQAQRPCLDLLKTMSMNCSSRAFEVLSKMGSNAILQQSQDGDDVVLKIDIVEIEAGKLISEICSSENVTVVVSRTRNGLTATIDLPGAKYEDQNSIHSGASIEPKEGREIEEVSEDESVDEDERSDDSYDERDTENHQLKEINGELMREVEKLRAQKDRLEQQVAVLSEGSSYM